MGDAIMDAIAYESTASDAVPEAKYVALPEKGPRSIPSAREIVELSARRSAAEAEVEEHKRATQLQADKIIVTPMIDEQILDMANRGWKGMRFPIKMPKGMTQARFIEVGQVILSEPPYKSDDAWFELKPSKTEGYMQIIAEYVKPAAKEKPSRCSLC